MSTLSFPRKEKRNCCEWNKKGIVKVYVSVCAQVMPEKWFKSLNYYQSCKRAESKEQRKWVKSGWSWLTLKVQLKTKLLKRICIQGSQVKEKKAGVSKRVSKWVSEKLRYAKAEGMKNEKIKVDLAKISVYGCNALLFLSSFQKRI